MHKTKTVIVALIAIGLLSSGFGCKGVDPEAQKKMEPITIDYWRALDGKDDLQQIIEEYNKMQPHVTINYRKFRYEEYEEELINAMAEDRGPDIFSIQNTWIKKYQNKIIPLPDKLELVYPKEEGVVQKETVPVFKTKNTISLKGLQEKFVDAVYHDVVIETEDEEGNTQKNIYALPLYMDTLAMFYNRDLLNNAGIAEPPKYWNREFQKAVGKLTKQDSKGRLVQSGVALGGSDNIQRSSDILSLLMMQNGSTMMKDGNVNFHQIPPSLKKRNYNPGLEALRFYTDFANPAKEVYCWNNSLNNSLDLFTQGKLAIMFGYSYHIPMIKARSPKLNFSVTNMPQIESGQKVNYANYWVEVVSKKSEHVEEAWNFIQFATTNPDITKTYLKNTNRPTALRSLINEQIEDIDIGIFAEQILTAKSWYKGDRPLAAEEAIKDMINAANQGEEKMQDVIQSGASRVQQTIYENGN